MAGIAGGAAARRFGAPKPAPSSRFSGLKNISLPRPKGKVDLSKVDIDSLTQAGKRAGEIGRQIGEVASAVERARKGKS